ncbi:MAG TPA: alpha/beta hydrolase [Alphaproteobacteria bacterium]|nr:alpha/beta hydrolase [Alphaproteobacteria bacterium]
MLPMIEETRQPAASGNDDLLRFRQTGTGRPVVLLHGLLGGSFCWRLTEPVLASTHTVFSIDLPGHGLADAPADFDGSMQNQAALLQRFLEQRRLGPLDILAASWGGAVALHLAARWPKVRRLVLVAPVNPWSANGSKRIRLLSSAAGGLLLRAVWPFSRPALGPGVRRLYADPAKIPSGTVAGYAERIWRPRRSRNLLSILKNWQSDMASLSRIIPEVSARTLLVWGESDNAVDPSSAGMLQRALPNARAVMLPSVGHLPFEEAPDEFNRLVLDFLATPV